MRRATMIDLIKEEITECLATLHVDNLPSCTKALESQVNILKALSEGVFLETAQTESETRDSTVSNEQEEKKKGLKQQIVLLLRTFIRMSPRNRRKRFKNKFWTEEKRFKDYSNRNCVEEQYTQKRRFSFQKVFVGKWDLLAGI